MKLTKSTVATSLAALLIGGLSVTPASAKVRTWADLTFTTHGPVAEQVSPFVPNRQQYSRTDISAITHVGAEASTYTADSTGNHRRSDISSVTHK